MEDQTGKEGQLCGPNGACDDGLTCVSQVCVNLGDVSEETEGDTEGNTADEGGDDNGAGAGLHRHRYHRHLHQLCCPQYRLLFPQRHHLS